MIYNNYLSIKHYHKSKKISIIHVFYFSFFNFIFDTNIGDTGVVIKTKIHKLAFRKLYEPNSSLVPLLSIIYINKANNNYQLFTLI